MSNLNDFIGGTSLKFWRHEGHPAITTHGPYDSEQYTSIEVLGTTSDTHLYGQEYKLHHVPDKKIYAYTHANTGDYPIYVKLNLSASTTNAPNPSEGVVHSDNLVPTLQAVTRCLSYKFYSKQNETDAYTLHDTIDFSGITFASTFGQYTDNIESTASNYNERIKFGLTYTTSSGGTSWQDLGSISNSNFGRIYCIHQMKPNLDEAYITTSNEGQIIVKFEWALDTTAYNNLFSRSYNEIEGIKFANPDHQFPKLLYAGERQYGSGLYAGDTII